MMYPAFIYADGPWKNWPFAKLMFTVSLFIVATCSAGMFFVFAQRELFGKQALWKSILHLPLLMALGIGVCINNTKAVFEAVWSAMRRKPTEFVRTQKYGVSGRERSAFRPQRVFTFSRLVLPILEIAFGIYMICFIFISLYYSYARGGVPFLAIFAGGYLYVGCTSLYVLWRMHQEAVQEALDAQDTSEALSL
jgi:hypothetical protein